MFFTITYEREIMKKNLLVLTTLGLSTVASQAMADNLNYDYEAALNGPYAEGFYIQADAGASRLSIDLEHPTGTITQSDNTFSPRIALGYDFGTFRMDLGYNKYGKIKFNDPFHSSIKVTTIDARFIKSFNNDAETRPFVGAKLNYSSFDLKTDLEGVKLKYKDSAGVGALAGFEHRINRNIFIGSSIEANYLSADPVLQLGANAFLRFKF